VQGLQQVWPLGPGLQDEPTGEFLHCHAEIEAVGTREGPVTLSSAALGPASSSEEDPNEDTPPPPHLMVPVDLRKGSGGKSYYPYSALVDLSATYNFIS
jgi:hypothetical protein